MAHDHRASKHRQDQFHRLDAHGETRHGELCKYPEAGDTELGGNDPAIICDDVNVDAAFQRYFASVSKR